MEGLVLKKKGFSYIEVLIAITISAVIFSAVLPLIYDTITMNRDTRLKLLAYEAAENQVEELREAKVPSLCPQPIPQASPCDQPFSVPGIPGATGHTYIQKTLGDQQIATVYVVVNWTLKNKAQKAEIRTYLYGSTQ